MNKMQKNMKKNNKNSIGIDHIVVLHIINDKLKFI